MTKISKKRPWLVHLCTKLGNYTEDKGCVGRQNRKKEMDKDRDRGRGRELTNGTWDLSEQRRRRRRRRPLFPTFAKKIPISDFDFCAKKRRIFWHFCFFIPDLTQSELVELFPSLYPSLPLYLSVFSLFANSSYLYNLYFSLSLSLSLSLSCFPPPHSQRRLFYSMWSLIDSFSLLHSHSLSLLLLWVYFSILHL